MLVFVEMKIAAPNAQVAQDAVSRGELGHDQAASAKVLDKAAEDGVGDAGHGCKHGGRSDADVSNLQNRGKHPGQGGDGGIARPSHRRIRVVPELLHDLILRPFSSNAIARRSYGDYRQLPSFARHGRASRPSPHKSKASRKGGFQEYSLL